MKKRISIIILICFILSLVSSELLIAFELQSQTQNMAVLNLVALDEMGQEEANLYTKRLIRELGDDARITCLSQMEITNRLVNTPINPSSCSSLECGIQAGQLLGVPLIVIGNLSKIDNLFSLNIRLVDVGNERIIKTIRDEFRGNEVEFFSFLADIAVKLMDIPDTIVEQPPVQESETKSEVKAPPTEDPVLQQILQQPTGAVNRTDQQQTTRPRPSPSQSSSQPVVKTSTSKWKLFGLLVLAGAGAAVLLLKNNDDDGKKLPDQPTVTTPLPSPPSFPKKR